jgi:hypothetical protein
MEQSETHQPQVHDPLTPHGAIPVLGQGIPYISVLFSVPEAACSWLGCIFSCPECVP